MKEASMASIRTPVAILSFPVLFTPKPRAQNGEPVFSCCLLFDKTAQSTPEFGNLRKAIDECIDLKWGKGKAADKEFRRTLRLPLRRCEEMDYAGYDIPGGLFISPWSNNRPGIIDAWQNDITVPADVWA